MNDKPFIWDFRGRRSVRLPGQNYDEPVFYTVTICTEGKRCLFGRVRNGSMELNDAGRMVLETLLGQIKRYPFMGLDAFVIMPNHMHAIIHLMSEETIDPEETMINQILPDDIETAHPHRQDMLSWIRQPHGILKLPDRGEHKVRPYPSWDAGDLQYAAHSSKDSIPYSAPDANSGRGEPCVRPDQNQTNHPTGTEPGSLGRIVQSFKSITTHEYIIGVKKRGWEPFQGRLWQRSYWDSILWTDRDIDYVRDYIIENPENWERDKLYPNP